MWLCAIDNEVPGLFAAGSPGSCMIVLSWPQDYGSLAVSRRRHGGVSGLLR